MTVREHEPRPVLTRQTPLPARGWERHRCGLVVPEGTGPAPPDQPVGVDLFAGAGGFSLGMKNAGFHVAGAVEHDVHAALTYLTNLARYGECTIHFETQARRDAMERALDQENERRSAEGAIFRPLTMGSGHIAHHPRLPSCRHFWLWDARNLDGAQILEALELRPGELDVVFGGPPCQGFSVAGKRDVRDPRNELVFEFIRLVLETEPRTMAMENVSGIGNMVTRDGLPVIDAIADALAKGGWQRRKAMRRMLESLDVTVAVTGAPSSRETAAEPPDSQQLGLF